MKFNLTIKKESRKIKTEKNEFGKKIYGFHRALHAHKKKKFGNTLENEL